MQQQLKHFMLTVLVALCSITAFAHDFEVDGIYYNYNSDGTVEVTYRGDYYYTYNNEYTGTVIIPSSVTYNGKTYSVTGIGESAFCSCSGLTSTTIGNSVESIGNDAFSGCSGLTTVNFNATKCTSIGSASSPVFSTCHALQTLNIGDNVTVIPDYAFESCSGLTSVTIPNSVTSIGNWVFAGCSGLTSITIPNSVTSIGNSAFVECSSLTTVNFNATECTSMGSDYYPVFRYCSALQTLNIGDNVTVIPDYAFQYCSGLTSVTIGNSVTSIGYRAFSGCSGLTSVTIGNSVTSIGEGAFLYCRGLTSVTIPNSVTSIGEFAFMGCRGLTSVTIPGTVKVLKEGLFDGCTNLTSVTISEGIEVLKSAVFADCCNLESIYLPSTLKSIEGYGSFIRCYKLASILVSPYNSHFYSTGTVLYSKDGHKLMACACALDGEFEIPTHVQQIASGAFYGCEKLTKIVIPDGITKIDSVMFADCHALKEIVIPNTVTYIGVMAFQDCCSLGSIVIPPLVTEIFDAFGGAFMDCNNLKTIYNLSDLNIVAGSTDYGHIAYYADVVYTGLPETIKLTVSAAEYATLILPFDAEVPQGIKAYTCDVVRGSTLLLTEADKLEAYTPYIIYGYNVADADGECLVRGELGVMNNTYSFTGAPTRREKQFEVGQLVGTLEDIYAPQGSYVLQSQDGVVGFYRVAVDNSITVKANRAYLKAQASGIRAFTFAFAEDDETAVRSVVATEKDAETYSLSGVRVSKGYKGIVIRNGKKFLNR